MIRFLGGGLFGLLALGLWVYCILDVISTDEALVRNLPKVMWLLLVIFLPTVGSIAWLVAGRPLFAGWAPGDTRTRGAPRMAGPAGPEDRPDWNAEREERLERWERELRRREIELRRRGEGGDPDKPRDGNDDDKPFPFSW